MICAEVDCGMLPEPANGAVDMSEGSTVGSEVTYTCDPSFKLRGEESRTCQPDGSWSGENPVCEGNHYVIMYSVFSCTCKHR